MILQLLDEFWILKVDATQTCLHSTGQLSASCWPGVGLDKRVEGVRQLTSCIAWKGFHQLVAMVQDKNWRELLKYCAAREAYRGYGASEMEHWKRSEDAADDLWWSLAIDENLEHTGTQGPLAVGGRAILRNRSTCMVLVHVENCLQVIVAPSLLKSFARN